MAQIPAVTTIRTEDFAPDQRKWIGTLLLPLNQFLTTVTNAINGNITFGDNIPGVTTTLSFVYGTQTDYPKNFKWPFTSRPVEVRLCSAFEDGTPVALGFAWSYASGSISVTSFYKISGAGISALRTGAKYNIVMRGQL